MKCTVWPSCAGWPVGGARHRKVLHVVGRECALDQVPNHDPYSMAAVIAGALEAALPPDEWDTHRLALTGLTSELDESFVPRPVTDQNRNAPRPLGRAAAGPHSSDDAGIERTALVTPPRPHGRSRCAARQPAVPVPLLLPLRWSPRMWKKWQRSDACQPPACIQLRRRMG